MNRSEAQNILGAYRASGKDAADPQFQAALELTEQDPELARWFAEQQSFDAHISKTLRAFPVSPRMRDQLLVAHKIIRPDPWWRKPSQIAAAAVVLVSLAIITFLLFPRRGDHAGFADLQRTIAKASVNMASHLDVTGGGTEELHKWIADHGGSSEFELPNGLRSVRLSGCKVLDWHGHKVTLLCFMPDEGHFDVFVVNEADLPGVRVDNAAQFSLVDGVTIATWCRDRKVYLLSSKSPQPELGKLL